MNAGTVLKILTVVVIGVLCIICYQILLTTSPFNNVDSKIPDTHKSHSGHAKVVSEQESEEGQVTETNQITNQYDSNEFNIMITFTNAKGNGNLQDKFTTTVKSLFKWTSIPLNIYIIGDVASQEIAEGILKGAAEKYTKEYKVVKLDTEDLAKKLEEVINDLRPFFSYKPGAYYSHALFFFSIAIHKVMPETLHRVIMMDADLKFNQDIKELYLLFNNFSERNVMGLARENQPVYRHMLSTYRMSHPGTRLGDPPPNGITGFNSGVLLLDLDRMKKSETYNSLITSKHVKEQTEKYSFKGNLGDQDLYSLLSLENEELFYILPCTWNRQLCIWWKDKGYESVFDLYFKCDGHINIYHGNCNTQIPKLDWEI